MRRIIFIWFLGGYILSACCQGSDDLSDLNNHALVTLILSQDSILSVLLENQNCRIEYVDKNRKDFLQFFKASPSKLLPANKGPGQRIRYFYCDISEINTSINGIFHKINLEFSNISENDTYTLIKTYLPDTAVEYHIYGYKGKYSASVEALYFWESPLRAWKIGVDISIRSNNARTIIDNTLCLASKYPEADFRKVKLQQRELLMRMNDSDIFCP